MKTKDIIKKSLICACIFATLGGVPLFAQESPYSFTRGFPANDETIKQAQDATDLRRAIEAYKFFFPTVAMLNAEKL